MLKTKSKRRKTPWDPRPCKLPANNALEARPIVPMISNGGICLHGLYVLDPRVSTSSDMRQFFWAGLQLLDSEVKKIGLSGAQTRSLMLASFDTFHDAANGLWDTVRVLMAKGGGVRHKTTAQRQLTNLSGLTTTHAVIGSDFTSAFAPTTLTAAIPMEAIALPYECFMVAPALMEQAGVDKNLETDEYPDADFYQPAAFDWTPEGYEVRVALKRYSESTNADR